MLQRKQKRDHFQMCHLLDRHSTDELKGIFLKDYSALKIQNLKKKVLYVQFALSNAVEH